MIQDIFNWIATFWWTVILSLTFSFGMVAHLFNHIIKAEMERGGEEYAERAVTRIQKWATMVLVISIAISALTIILKVLTAFDLIHLGF